MTSGSMPSAPSITITSGRWLASRTSPGSAPSWQLLPAGASVAADVEALLGLSGGAEPLVRSLRGVSNVILPKGEAIASVPCDCGQFQTEQGAFDISAESI